MIIDITGVHCGAVCVGLPVILRLCILIIIKKKLTSKCTKNYKFSIRVGSIVARSKRILKQAGVVHDIKSQ